MSRPTPDPVGNDHDVLGQSEALDEDNTGVDPLEDGMDPAEGWAGADAYGTTASEQASGEPLTERLREERPDVTGEQPPERPASITPIDELDESIDDEVPTGEPMPPEEGVLVGTESDDTGESATRRAGYLVTEPDQSATDETANPREE
jgi:hypothetical protein